MVTNSHANFVVCRAWKIFHTLHLFVHVCYENSIIFIFMLKVHELMLWKQFHVWQALHEFSMKSFVVIWILKIHTVMVWNFRILLYCMNYQDNFMDKYLVVFVVKLASQHIWLAWLNPQSKLNLWLEHSVIKTRFTAFHCANCFISPFIPVLCKHVLPYRFMWVVGLRVNKCWIIQFSLQWHLFACS